MKHLVQTQVNCHPGRDANSRSGVTLPEVLMALLVMGIGVVAVAAMFPIAVLRSVQANTLTNATILKANAESLIEVMPNLIHNPDFGDNPNPGDQYSEHFLLPANRRYVVDPLGFAYAATDGRKPGRFGGSGPFRFLGMSPNATMADAAALVSLPDSWDTLLDDRPVKGDLQSTELDLSKAADTDFSGLDFSRDLAVYLYDERTGAVANARITQLDGNRLSLDSIPPNLTSVDRIRIDVRVQKYTWMLTVRKNPVGDANGDIVVFFRRSFTLEDESPHQATFTAGNPIVNITPTPGTNPLVRGGGYILDAENLRWYRVQQVLIETDQLIQVQLARPALENSSSAILMRGIIAVFPMNTRGL